MATSRPLVQQQITVLPCCDAAVLLLVMLCCYVVMLLQAQLDGRLSDAFAYLGHYTARVVKQPQRAIA